MQRKASRLTRHILPASISIIVLAICLGLAFVRHGQTEAAAASTQAVVKSLPSEFSFTGAAGWYKGPTNRTSMALFKNDHECFTSIEHISGSVNVATELQKQQTMFTDTGDTITALATPFATVQTNKGSQQYELHEFRLASGDKNHPLMGGLGLGYVQLSSGYLKIQSHCNTADELPAALPALQAYTFNKE